MFLSHYVMWLLPLCFFGIISKVDFVFAFFLVV